LSIPAQRSIAEPEKLIETLVSLAKRRGFIFPSSEIYGGINAIYDFGPLGVALKHNIRQLWWRQMVELRHDIVGLESSIIMAPKVWEASGHVAGFTDPLVELQELPSTLPRGSPRGHLPQLRRQGIQRAAAVQT